MFSLRRNNSKMFWKCLFLNSQKTTIRTSAQKEIFPLLPTFGRFHRRQVIKTSLKRDAVDVYFCETQQAQKQITVSDLNVGQKKPSYCVPKEEKSLLFSFLPIAQKKRGKFIIEWESWGRNSCFDPFAKFSAFWKKGGKSDTFTQWGRKKEWCVEAIKYHVSLNKHYKRWKCSVDFFFLLSNEKNKAIPEGECRCKTQKNGILRKKGIISQNEKVAISWVLWVF